MDPAETPILLGRSRLERWLPAAVFALAIAVMLLAGAWWSTRSELAELRDGVAKQLREAGTDARDSRTIAKEVQEAVRDAQARIGALEAKLLESQSQQLGLQALYQELSRSRDEWVLAEVEQTLAIAAQQLQLAGNVRAALVALENADARLARSDRPQFLGLRRVIARDIDRLRNAPSVDIAGMTLRLDQLIAAVDQLPLLADGRPKTPDPTPADEPAGWQRRWWAVWEELKSLVRVQRLDASDPALLAPESRLFLRENLKLRLLHARLALLRRDESAFRADVKAAQTWLGRWFDPRQKQVATSAQTLAALNAAAVSVELPTIAESLSAVRNLKLPREKAVK
ncbi:MAG: uroporphyrinogen-III C-methyltransferase [Burkholderiales bacterium]